MRRNVFFCTMDTNSEGSRQLSAMREGGCWYQKADSPEEFHFICNPYQYAGTTYSFDLTNRTDEEYAMLEPIFKNTVICPMFVNDMMRAVLYKNDNLVIFMGEATTDVETEKEKS